MPLKFDWIKPTRGNTGKRRGTAGANGVRVSHGEYKKSDGTMAYSSQIRLGPDVMKYCRFLVGDRVVFAVAGDGKDMCMAIRRDPSGDGFTLSNARGKQAHGKHDEYGTLKMSRKDIPQVDVPLSACSLNDQGFLIVPILAEYLYE